MKIDPMDLLLHTLGLNEHHDDPWRNYFVTVQGGGYAAALDGLVDQGLMVRSDAPGFCPSGSVLYRATDLGKAQAVTENRRRKPKLTRSQRRYREWLDLSDTCDITFGDWLRMGCKMPDPGPRPAWLEWL